MRLNTPMLVRGLRRLMRGRPGNMASMAVDQTRLHPEEVTQVPPAIYADHALDRIVSASPWCDLEREVHVATGGEITHIATEARVLPDVQIGGPFLYCGGASHRHGFGPQRMMLDGAPRHERLKAAHLVTNWPASEFFGNHLLDNYALEMLPDDDVPLIGMVTRPYGHDEGYRALLGLPKPPEITLGTVERLTTYVDFSQNALKARRYRTLRSRIREAVGPADSVPVGVYIRRGKSGESRSLANEAAIENHLASLGFDIVVPDDLDAREIARRTLDAPIVSGVEGSHLSHGIFTVADGGCFLVLQPPARFAMAYKEFTDCLDMRYAFIVGEPAGDGFSVDPNELGAMLDRLL